MRKVGEPPVTKWEVVVGNLGRVFSGTDENLARRVFKDYFDRWDTDRVVLLKDGELVEEHPRATDKEEDFESPT